MGPIIAYAWENTLISYKWYKELIGKRRHGYYRKRIFSNNVNNLRIVGINCSAPKERKLIETKAKWMVSEIHIHPTCFWVCFYLFIYFFLMCFSYMATTTHNKLPHFSHFYILPIWPNSSVRSILEYALSRLLALFC